MAFSTPEEIYLSVKNYYGKVLSKTSDLKTSACCTLSRPPLLIQKLLKQIPEEIIEKYYGCGTPIPFGIEGLHVLDLGSGSGRDCYLASALVGKEGSVTGIDMTTEQIEVSKSHVAKYTETLGYKKPNLKFVEGYIECLDLAGVEPSSKDLVISNCVVNLSPNKTQVIEQVYKCLKEGGEFYFSDVYCTRRLDSSIQTHPVLLGECLGGALYIEDFKRICRQVGFEDPRQLSCSRIEVEDAELKELVGEAEFYSITYRCFKLMDLESLCEDYGQIAVYKGGIPENANAYQLDDHHRFEKNLPLRVCGNTASMLKNSWLKRYFSVSGDRNTHYGLFDCSVVKETKTSSCC